MPTVKKDYYAFCDAKTMEVAEKTKVVKFLEDKDNGNIYKRLELLTYKLYEALSEFDSNFGLEKLSQALGIVLQDTRDDELKEKFVKHCINNHAPSDQGLNAMGYVLVGMLKNSDRLKQKNATKNKSGGKG